MPTQSELSISNIYQYLRTFSAISCAFTGLTSNNGIDLINTSHTSRRLLFFAKSCSSYRYDCFVDVDKINEEDSLAQKHMHPNTSTIVQLNVAFNMVLTTK